MGKGAAGIGLAIILLALGIGAAFGFMFLPRILGRSTVMVHHSHQDIVDRMELTISHETIASRTLDVHCIDSGPLKWGAGITPLLSFKTGYTYHKSLWMWNREGDTEAAMEMWGPGDDGKQYFIEISRLTGYTLTVRVDGVQKGAITPPEGYLQLVIELED